MQKWEYLTRRIWASVDNEGWEEYKREHWPNWRPLSKYTPETMIPQLNRMGEEGWELITMQPVCGGSNADVGFGNRGPSRSSTGDL